MKYPENWSKPHVIAWRLMWSPAYFAAVAAVVSLTLIIWGPRDAARVWEGLR